MTTTQKITTLLASMVIALAIAVNLIPQPPAPTAVVVSTCEIVAADADHAGAETQEFLSGLSYDKHAWYDAHGEVHGYALTEDSLVWDRFGCI